MKKTYLAKLTTIKNLKKMLKTGGVQNWLIVLKTKN